MKRKLEFFLGSMILLTSVKDYAEPVITGQTTDQSVSLGASALFQISATTTSAPILYQWRFLGSNLPLATNSSLGLTNIQLTNAGAYDAVLTDGSGSITSQVAYLEVDPTFTKITANPIVNDAGSWAACAWGDYDGDGLIDLFIASTLDASGNTRRNALYRNQGSGTFVRITTGGPVTEFGDWRGCAWADYDDDGYLDLMVTRVDTAGFPGQASLYRNNGNGTFAKQTTSLLGKPVAGGYSEECVWGDYDNDGFLDLYVARNSDTDWLLHNNGDGTLTRVTNNIGIPPDLQDSYGVMWGDYDNDGWPDLFVTVKSDYETNQNNFLYHNNRNGTFTKVVTGSVVTDNEHSVGCTWVDYDNDGYLDLFVVNGSAVSVTNSLYRNNGDGTFTKQTSHQVGSIVGDAAYFGGCTWGDYDNDGFVDVFVTTVNGDVSFLYHNNGNGTFSRVLSGSLANDQGNAFGCAWGDYDNDGNLDLVVARGTLSLSTNLLYHNNGNTNGWLKVKLIGRASNQSAVGARVRVKAIIRGRPIWQLREITSGNGFASSPLEAHFGLGNATNVDVLRIEWPSGIVQTLT
ncbi:MAG: FG-GAP-like repeat-containing protein, partial [Verrucomicrobia bacterium]|nr:FG-GAP-like repeat-containing protein [Verrucomicrobiota bacterium]